MKTNETKKSWLQVVKEIEAREPEVLTKEYTEEYLGAIRWLVVSSITEEEAARYFVLPEDIYTYYEKRLKDVERYRKEHF